MMRAVIQRVSRAKVTVAGAVSGEIGKGLLVLLGVADDDDETDAIYLARKIVELRIFEDDAGKMNLALAAVQGSMLVVSQFTLLGDCRKGRRPSFDRAARPEQADVLYQKFISEVSLLDTPVATGRFQQHMEIDLTNDGPVTLIVESP